MSILRKILMLCVILVANAEKRFYDSYKGTTISQEQLKRHDKLNNTFWCTVEVEDCDHLEGRRLDGSCNNPKHPTRGSLHTPFLRVLPAVYASGFEPRKAQSGSELPLARKVRTGLLSEGRVSDQTFTQLLTYFWVFMSADTSALHDTINYIEWTPYCCLPKGKTDPMCTPNLVPDDDPVFRFSDIRCLNMTRPISFQTARCVANTTTPERITSATPTLDLSVVYGSALNLTLRLAKKFEGGLLKYEEENGKVWPPSSKNGVCRLNQLPQETRCHATPDDSTNTVAGLNLGSIWFWRLHNKIARSLAVINPCWDDEKLFNTARDINIAIATQIFYYEMLPSIMGRENMIRDNVITPTLGFRDFYDENSIPQVSLELAYAVRWLHTVQESRIRMYDPKGNYLKEFPMVNLTLRTGFLAVDDNIDHITNGAFRQPMGKVDYIVDPDMVGVVLGPHQRASDVMTNDLAKGRYFGFPPYVKYREFCSGTPVRSFLDLADIIDPERLERLKQLYETVEDIELMAGLWVERPIPGGFVPPTFYCLVVDQLIRNLITDRHWFERPNRPNAFTFEQLQEVRKISIATILCDVGDQVEFIQPHAFLRDGPGNEINSCALIPKMDLEAWTDLRCSPQSTASLYQ